MLFYFYLRLIMIIHVLWWFFTLGSAILLTCFLHLLSAFSSFSFLFCFILVLLTVVVLFFSFTLLLSVVTAPTVTPAAVILCAPSLFKCKSARVKRLSPCHLPVGPAWVALPAVRLHGALAMSCNKMPWHHHSHWGCVHHGGIGTAQETGCWMRVLELPPRVVYWWGWSKASKA